MIENKPATAAGERLLAAISDAHPAISERSAAADAAESMSAENFADLKRSGIAAAFVPEALGGMGLTSMQDWALAIKALARADGSTAIALNMHLGATRGMAERWANGGQSDALARPLLAVVAGQMLVCATATERGTDNLRPLTEAVPVDDEHLEINGAKMFVTLSPLASHLGMNVRMRADGEDWVVGTALPLDTPGVIPQDDWQALGMRGSGSQSIRFEGVRIKRSAVRKVGPWGRWSVGTLLSRAMGNLPLIGAFVGIAEAAYGRALQGAGRSTAHGEPLAAKPGVQHLIAEMLQGTDAMPGSAGLRHALRRRVSRRSRGIRSRTGSRARADAALSDCQVGL